MMEIFVVFKAYRQRDGEYLAVETEVAFPTKEQADAYVKDKPQQWWEEKEIPLNVGGLVKVEFLGLRSVHATELKGM